MFILGNNRILSTHNVVTRLLPSGFIYMYVLMGRENAILKSFSMIIPQMLKKSHVLEHICTDMDTNQCW